MLCVIIYLSPLCRDDELSLTQNEWTPLISAAKQGHCDVVIDLLSLGADFNAQNNVSHHPHWIH